MSRVADLTGPSGPPDAGETPVLDDEIEPVTDDALDPLTDPAIDPAIDPVTGSPAGDARIGYRVVTFGLAPRFHRLLEIICRHARHNPYRFEIGEALSSLPPTIDGLVFDIAVVDVTTEGGSETARLLKLLPSGKPVIEVGRRLHHARGSDDVQLRNFSLEVLSVLNHTVAALLQQGRRRQRALRLAPVRGAGASPDPQAPKRRAPRVLVVDPSPSIRSQVAVAIRRIGADAEEVASLEAAVAILAQRRYELVITELDLPDGDGLDVMRAVRRLDPVRRAAVVVLSQRDGWLDQARAAMAGCTGFLAKPVTFATLHATARRTLARQHASTRYVARDVAGAFTARDGWLARWSTRGASGTMLPPASSAALRRADPER